MDPHQDLRVRPPTLQAAGRRGRGPTGPGRGRKGEIRETSHSGRTRQTGSGQGGAGSGAPEWGGRALGGRSAAEAATAADLSGRVGNPEILGAAWLHETRFPKTPDTFKSPAQGTELRFWLRPRPDPQDSAGYPKGGCVGGDSEMASENWGAREGESTVTGVLGAGWSETAGPGPP